MWPGISKEFRARLRARPDFLEKTLAHMAREIEMEPAGRNAQKIAQAREVTNLVVSEASAMILTTIEHVHKGHHEALKVLFQVIGLFSMPAEVEEQKDHGLAKALLDSLGLGTESSQETVTKGQERSTMADHPAVE